MGSSWLELGHTFSVSAQRTTVARPEAVRRALTLRAFLQVRPLPYHIG